MFKRVLVANRGEIAVRIFRTLRDMNITPLAIYSEADRHALHVRVADEAFCVGPEASSESYLRIDKVLEAARVLNADAIHPGYGFLSENAQFATAVVDAGIGWIGPPPQAIVKMGDKLTARQTVEQAGVPLVPGESRAMACVEEALSVATKIGFPVMLKASAGGGGKGMRLIEDAASFESAFTAARREASNAFGNDAVYVEKFVTTPHHIEIQVLSDKHGNTVHLGERECSAQRRHQKVLEECPSPFIDEATRLAMGEVAVKAAQACDYVGAGTVEFLVGGDGQFYFLEMNTRLQVEHPVTELVYNVDLVECQVRIAFGEPLEFVQAELIPRGHALECRVYAEDPVNFLPSPGDVTSLDWPHGVGIRVDAGIDERSTVPMSYDPMVAKICTYGRSRNQAIRRMRRAIEETRLLGIETNLALHLVILDDARFIGGEYDTGLLANLEGQTQTDCDALLILAAALSAHDSTNALTQSGDGTNLEASTWLAQGRRRQLRGAL
jgi:acetyl-CoA carboxylase, biotin carboxylase subunit